MSGSRKIRCWLQFTTDDRECAKPVIGSGTFSGRPCTRSKPLGPPLPEADERLAGALLLGLRDVLAEALADEVHEEPGRIVPDLARLDGGGDEVQGVGLAGLHPARVRGLDEEHFEAVDAAQVQRCDVSQRGNFLPFQNASRFGGPSFLIL